MNRQPQPDEKDQELWQEELAQIKPAKRSGHLSKPLPAIKVRPHIAYEKINNLQPAILTTEKMADIDKNTAQKFKQGKLPIEGRLDLHGYTEKAAWEEVSHFIKKAYLQHKRCLLIITGKGNRIYENDDILAAHGILKEQLPRWLNHPELRPLILASCPAQPKDGGSGAFYILLRRQRA